MTKTPITQPKNHWIPEETVARQDAEAASAPSDAAQEKKDKTAPEAQREAQTATLQGVLSAMVPDLLKKPAVQEQGIVSSLGLVLSTNEYTEVVFIR